MTDIKKNRKSKKTMSEAEMKVLAAEYKTHPKSKLESIEELPKPGKQEKREKKLLSQNNFNHDLDGNTIIQGRALIAPIFKMIVEGDIKYFGDKEQRLFWQVGKHYVSEPSMEIIETVLAKKTKAYLAKLRDDSEREFSATTLRETHIWKEVTEDVFDNQNQQSEVPSQETTIDVSDLVIEPITSIGSSSKDDTCESQVVVEENVVSVSQQLEKLQKTLDDVLAMNKELQASLAAKDALIEKLMHKLSESTIEAPKSVEVVVKKVEEVPQPSTSKSAMAQDKVLRNVKSVKTNNNTQKIKKPLKVFDDDGIDVKLTVDSNTSEKEALEVLDNNIKLTPEMQRKVVNQGVRDVTTEKIVEPFNEKLSENLVESEQTFKVQEPLPKKVEKAPVQQLRRANTLVLFTPRQKSVIVKDPNCPAGITAIRWNFLKTETDKEKLDLLIRKDYSNQFRTDFYILQSRWKTIMTNYRNPYLLNAKFVWSKLSQNKTENLYRAIQVWGEQAKKIVPVGAKLTANQLTWFKRSNDK